MVTCLDSHTMHSSRTELFAWIEEMYVIEAMRRNGIGLALEMEFERWAGD